MPTKFTGRLILIFAIVWGAVSMIFPTIPGSMVWIFQPNAKISLKPNLKPGIDMVGGTSLLYEIKQPPGGWNDPKPLSEVVMESLKKRVDPTGVRNLIWRPQGNQRLEIQMPLSGTSGQSKARREDFENAQRQLEATNVRALDVLSAVEDVKGEKRTARLHELAMNSPARQKLFDELTATYDEIADAKAKNDRDREAAALNKYDDLKDQIAHTNLPPQTLQDAIDSTTSPDQKIADIKAREKDFPARETAIDQFVTAYRSYSAVKNSIDDAGDLKRLLRGSGVLEFHILATPGGRGGGTITDQEFLAMKQRLQKDGPQVRAGDTMRWFAVDKPDDFKGTSVGYNDKQYVLAFITPGEQLVNGPGTPQWTLNKAGGGMQDSGRVVSFEFDATGSKLFGDLTTHNVGKQLGIVLDDKMISAPNINSPIYGNGVITGGRGGFSVSEQKYLASTLNAGSLPAQLTDDPISERTVGPQLGADNLRKGLLACVFGLVVVGVFLIGYYYIAGMVAFLAVLINVLVILGVMAMLNATFTLPGVAGIVLAIGAAVDANVLIFERLREEQHRGLSLKMALRNSYDRAFSAILDSNMTTVITSAILYWLGTEEVKGFGITLLVGLCCSMFTALYVTKTIFALLIEKFGLRNLSSLPLTFPKWDRMLQPKIDWMSKIWIFILISVVTIVVGCGAFWHYGQKHELLDIEFASGTSVQFALKEPMHIDQLRKLFPTDSPDLPSPAIVSVGTDDKTYELVTPSPNSQVVRSVILKSIGDRLTLERPSTFDGVAAKAGDEMDKLIFPVEPDRKNQIAKAAGFESDRFGSYRGGAAIILKNISPKLTPEQILQRIRRQRGQDQAGREESQADFFVASPAGNTEPTDTAIVFTSDPVVPYDIDPGKWRSELVDPVWKLIGEAINRPPTFQAVSNFDAQVAGDTQRDALMALGLSILVIMAYIWLRFGTLKYGTATTIAMIHDTALVLAAIGLSHLIYQYAPHVASWLKLEPFRLNITTVAAVLTVMSYSMIDTIVVFDRVRENRGRFGDLNRQVLNDSINQTMSRTLLTAGTNIVTLFFMYMFGGSGIHGFTFVLLFGILVGTYSSVAIAAPLLLVGKKGNSGPPRPGAAAKKPTTTGQLQRA